MAFIYNPNKTGAVIIYGYSGQGGDYSNFITGTNTPYVFAVWGDANFVGRIYYNGSPLLAQTDTDVFVPKESFELFSGNSVKNGYFDNVGMVENNVETSTGVSARFYLDTYNNTNVFGSSFRGRRFRGTSQSPSGVLTNDVLLQLVGDGYSESGFVESAAGSLAILAAENFHSGKHGSYIRLRTTPTGQGTQLERLLITSEGKIGVNNSNPQFTFDVSGSGNFTQGVYSNGVLVGGGGSSTNGVTGMVVTGGIAVSGNIILQGAGGTQTLLSGNQIIISSSLGGGGGEVNTASNLGDGSGLYSTKNGVDLRFKSLIKGDGVYLSGDSNEIVISAPRQWFQFTVGSVTLTNMATGQTFLVNSSAYVQRVDLSSFTGVSLSVNKVGTAGQPLSFLFLGYRSSFSTTAAAYAPLVDSHPKTYIDTTNNILNSGWFPITQAARGITHLALLGSGGNGVLDPVVGSIVAYFK